GSTLPHVTGALSSRSETLNVSAVSTLAALTMSGGTIGGTGALPVTGAMTWPGATISRTGALNAQGGLTLGAAGATDLEFLSGRTLNNAAAATLAAFNSSYGLYLSSGAVFDNKPGASFTILTDAQVSYNVSPAGTFLNEGS